MIKHLVFVFSLIVSITSFPQWSPDPGVNTPVCLAPDYQDRPQITADGNGGAIITWIDNRNPPLNANVDIYAQRIGADGIPKWTIDGIQVCGNSITQNNPQIVSDGNGGAIIVWEDLRNSLQKDIYAQRIDANGNTLWTNNGIPVCTSSGEQRLPMITSDGLGGAIITWVDERASINNIYAQRIDPNGVSLWTLNGISVCPATNNQTTPRIVSDENNGAIIMWIDNRTQVNENDVYAQRINANGDILWSTSGLAVCAIYRRQQIASIAPDGNGGAIIAWTDDRDTISTPRNSDVYAQRVDPNGNLLWASTGVEIASGPGNQKAPQIFNYGDGGSIIVWDDTRNGDNNRDIYAQRLSPTGSILWNINGIPICNAANDQDWQRIVTDDSGGAIISWEDERSGGNNRHIYAQRINETGSIQWTLDGVAISNATGYKSFTELLPIGSGNVVFTWGDERNGGDNRNIFVQQLNASGQIGVVTNVENEQQSVSDFILYQNYPNPFNPSTTIKYTIPNVTLSEVEGSRVQLKVYDVLGNEVATLVDEYKPAGSYEVTFDATALSSGVYICRLHSENYSSSKKLTLIK
jgi:hypothetical protein